MGDFVSLLTSFNLSPIITLLLVALGFVLRTLYARIDLLEATASKNRASIAYIKGKLGLGESEVI